MDKIFKVYNSEIKGIDEKEMTITAYISTDTRDRMDESLDPMGMDKKNYEKNPVVLWAHDYTQPPIGKAVWTKRQGNGVISKVKFAPTEFAQEIFNLYKEGFLKAFSVGFVPKKWEDGDGDKKPRRKYTDWELLEYSAVPVPANPDAVTLAMQKGILKTDSIIKSMEEDMMVEEPEYSEIENKGQVIENIEISTKESDGLDELLAEIDQLKELNSSLEKENQDLRYKYFEALKTIKTKLSEITVDDLAGKAAEIMNGVIRKHMGKVD